MNESRIDATITHHKGVKITAKGEYDFLEVMKNFKRDTDDTMYGVFVQPVTVQMICQICGKEETVTFKSTTDKGHFPVVVAKDSYFCDVCMKESDNEAKQYGGMSSLLSIIAKTKKGKKKK